MIHKAFSALNLLATLLVGILALFSRYGAAESVAKLVIILLIVYSIFLNVYKI